jgi:hypothetical protein
MNEALEAALATDDTERAVPGPHQFHPGRDDAAQNDLQIQSFHDRCAGDEKILEALLCVWVVEVVW